MKYQLAFLTATLLAVPAYAQSGHPHQTEKQLEIRVERHGAPQHGGQHGAQMEALLRDGQTVSARALDLLVAGNRLIEQGHAQKNGASMLKGAGLLHSGVRLHHQSMHALQTMHQGMKQHLMHASIGELQMAPAQQTALKQQADGLKAALDKHHAACHAEMAKFPAQAARLVELGNQQIQQAMPSANADQLSQGSALLEAGMQLYKHQSHGMDEGMGHGMGHGMGDEHMHGDARIERRILIHRQLD